MTRLEQTIQTLTLAQAIEWKNCPEKWLHIDDSILAPNDLRANDHTVNAVEDKFLSLLTAHQG